MKTTQARVSPRRARPGDATTVDAETGTRHLNSIEELRTAVNECRRCPLWRPATQGVPGEGRAPAELMLVGEAPGDVEDEVGRPFAGPAGAVLDRALHEAGINRKTVFVSNAVKHFKFEQRGKRRLHMKPNAGEIKACNWWLAEELKLVRPKLVIALGDCAINCGIFRGSYAVTGPVERHIPVDVRIAGCPPRPVEILKALASIRSFQTPSDE